MGKEVYVRVEVDMVEIEGAVPEDHTQSGRSYNWTNTLPSSNRTIGNKMPIARHRQRRKPERKKKKKDTIDRTA